MSSTNLCCTSISSEKDELVMKNRNIAYQTSAKTRDAMWAATNEVAKNSNTNNVGVTVITMINCSTSRERGCARAFVTIKMILNRHAATWIPHAIRTPDNMQNVIGSTDIRYSI